MAKRKAAEKTKIAIRNIDPPPDAPIPAVGRGFTPPPASVMRGYSKPSEPQREVAVDLVVELRTSKTWGDDLGKRAPDPAALADRLDVASKWDAVYSSAAAFAEYSLAMRAAAWDAAMRPMKTVSREYGAAVADDGAIARRYPHLSAFLGAKEAQAQRGVTTRKKNAKKKTAAAGSASK